MVTYVRSLLIYDRSLLIYDRSLLMSDRSLLMYDRSLLMYDRSLLMYIMFEVGEAVEALYYVILTTMSAADIYIIQYLRLSIYHRLERRLRRSIATVVFMAQRSRLGSVENQANPARTSWPGMTVCVALFSYNIRGAWAGAPSLWGC